MNLLLIALGGAAGTLARYGMNLALLRFSTRWEYPFATLAVNLLGCFLVGLLHTLLTTRAIPEPYRLATLVGFLGGFTTFSSFGLETAGMLREGQLLRPLLHLLLNNVLGIILVFAGWWLAKR